MVEVDHLGYIGQLREVRFVTRMVKAGAPVEEHERRFLPHGGTIGYEAGTLHIKEQSYTIHKHVQIVFLSDARPAYA